MRKVISIVAIVALTLAFAPISAAEAGNDLSWIPITSHYNDATMHGFAFTDKSPLPFQYSVLQGGSESGRKVCSSTTDQSCKSADYLNFNSILKVCTLPTDLDCIESIDSTDNAGSSTSGTFSNYTVNDHLNQFPEDSALGIPAGNVPSVWTIPGAAHKSSDQYAIIAGINGEVTTSGEETNFGRVFQLTVVPVALRDFGKGEQSIAQGWSQSRSDIFYDYCATVKRADGKFGPDCNHVNGTACFLPTNVQGQCYAEEPFGNVNNFSVTLRLSKEPNGWMHGRMTNPKISITPRTGGGVALKVSAGVTSVPMVYQDAPWESLPLSIKNLWVDCFKDQSSCGEFGYFRGMSTPPRFETLGTLEGQSVINVLQYINAFGPLPMTIMSSIAPLVGDKASAESSTWSVRTLSKSEMSSANQCFSGASGITGIVSTNSTAYSAGPPTFQDGALNYQVSSPHFLPDGTTPFKGNYNLTMRSEIARCLYGFSKAPISASISVISSEGNNDIATTTTTERDGWLSLNASNFQFSSPVIKVKLSQVQSISKITVTCVKGKTSKRISGLNPVCPKGFRKAS